MDRLLQTELARRMLQGAEDTLDPLARVFGRGSAGGRDITQQGAFDRLRTGFGLGTLPAKAVLDTLGLAREGLDYGTKTATGAAALLGDMALNGGQGGAAAGAAASVIPGLGGLLPFLFQSGLLGRAMDLGPLDRSDLANARAAFDQSGGNLFGRARAANEGLARESPYATGLVNMALDPFNYISGGGSEAARAGEKALRIGGRFAMDPALVDKILNPESILFDAAATKVSPVVRGLASRLGAQAGDVFGIRPSMVKKVKETFEDAGLLDQVFNPDDAAALRELFPREAISPVSPDALVRIYNEGRANRPAEEFQQFAAQNWARAQAGQLTEDDVINAYLPTILSQRRGALDPNTALFNPRRLEQLGSKYPDLVAMVNQGLTIGGEDAGKTRPEDLAALMLHYTREGQGLAAALKSRDPNLIHQAMDDFNAIWPDAGFFPGERPILEGPPAPLPRKTDPFIGPGVPTPADFVGPIPKQEIAQFPTEKKGPLKGLPALLRGVGPQDEGERGALIKAATSGAFADVASEINRRAMAGETGDQIATFMRDRAVRGKTLLPRVGEGKTGFLMNNLGGPSATFDVRVGKALKPGASLEDYQRALDILYPGEDYGVGHHKFWDSQAIDAITGSGSQTPHKGLWEGLSQMMSGRTFKPQDPSVSWTRDQGAPVNRIIPGGLAEDLGQANTFVPEDVPAGLANRPQMGYEELMRRKYQQEFYNGRAQEDIAFWKQKAAQSYQNRTGTLQGFDQLWDGLGARLEDLQTISVGIGDGAAARAIAAGGRGLLNGFALRNAMGAGEEIPESLIMAKARALGLTKGSPRYNESLAFGEARGIKDPAQAVREYAKHFIQIEDQSFDLMGAGSPLNDPEALTPVYASVTEGQPALNQMGGGIHLLMKDDTPYVGSVHHPFAAASPGVMPMHGTSAPELQKIWGTEGTAALSEEAGRPVTQRFGPEGDWEVSGTPMMVGPAAMSAARAASLVMTAADSKIQKAVKAGDNAAVELLRGSLLKQRGPKTALTRNLAGDTSYRRSEALLMNPGPEHVRGVLVKGQTPEILKDNVAGARQLLASWNIPDTPIYVAYGPEGSAGRVYELTAEGPVEAWLSKGREKLVQEYTKLGMQDLGGVAGTLKNVGSSLFANPTGNPVISRAGIAGSGGLIGASAGALAPADSEEARQQNIKTGALAGLGAGVGVQTPLGRSMLRGIGTGIETSKPLLQEAWDAQRAAMNRERKGIANLPAMANIWGVATTSTLRNILQEVGTSTLWLKNARIPLSMFRDNYASMMELYRQGVRDPYGSLPEMTRDFLDAFGKSGYIPKVGQSFTGENKKLIDQFSAIDTALGEGALSLANPLYGGVPLLGTALATAKGYTRAFQQSLYQRIDDWTKVAARHAAWQDEAESAIQVGGSQFLQKLQNAGINTNGLDVGTGFTAADVERRVSADLLGRGLAPPIAKQQAAALAKEWDQTVDTAISLGEERAKDIFGDFEKRGVLEKGIGTVVPFVSWALRAYPRTAKMMADHPGITLALLTGLYNSAEGNDQEGIPNYMVGSVPIPTTAPIIGGIAQALLGGQPGEARANLLGALSPVSGQAFADEDLPPDANLYQRATSMLGRAGFSFNPIIQGAAYAMNKDFRKPGALSRTATAETVMPGPELPSLAQGPLNFLREAAGGTAQNASPHDRKVAELYYQATGFPISDPSNMQDPDRRALLISTLDPESPIRQQADKEMRTSGLTKQALSLASPVTISPLSDQSRAVNQARALQATLPPAVYSPQAIAAVNQSHSMRSMIEAYLMQQMNAGTQGDLPPELLINRGAAPEDRLTNIQSGLATGNAYTNYLLQEMLGLNHP